jgi:hypothetical protein
VALDYLKHRADWQAAQKIEVSTTESISITVALERAQARVAEVIENHAATEIQSGRRADAHGPALVAQHR